MGLSSVLLRFRQRGLLVGAFSSFQLLHRLLSCLQRRLRQRHQRRLLVWRGLRILQDPRERAVRQSNRAAAKPLPLQKESLFPANGPKQSADAASRTLLAWRGYV